MTVCTHNRECLFGEIQNEEMELNALGQIVWDRWNRIPNHFKHVQLDAFQIMPNHIHGIVIIDDCRGGVTPPLRKPTLGLIVAYFKYQSTKEINASRETPGEKIWQRNYYDRIIRNEDELNKIKEYIINNPLKWELDKDNPANL